MRQILLHDLNVRKYDEFRHSPILYLASFTFWAPNIYIAANKKLSKYGTTKGREKLSAFKIEIFGRRQYHINMSTDCNDR